MTSPSPVLDPAAQPIVDALQGALERTLGTSLIGLYLYDSLSTGGFDAGVSDVDLLAVLADPLSPKRINALHRMHDQIAREHPAWVDRVEVVYLTASSLRNFRTENPTFPVISPGEPFHTRHEPLQDWLHQWYLIRGYGVALLGAPPTEILPPIAFEEFVVSLQRYLHELRHRLEIDRTNGSEPYIILTACRALCASETAAQPSNARPASGSVNIILNGRS